MRTCVSSSKCLEEFTGTPSGPCFVGSILVLLQSHSMFWLCSSSYILLRVFFNLNAYVEYVLIKQTPCLSFNSSPTHLPTWHALFFLHSSTDIHTEEETMKIISFTIVSQHSKYVGINPIQEMKELHSENFKILKKKRQKMIPNHVKNFHAHRLAGLISWKWSSYLRQSTDSVQLPLKFWEAVFYRNWKKKP